MGWHANYGQSIQSNCKSWIHQGGQVGNTCKKTQRANPKILLQHVHGVYARTLSW